MNSTTTTTSSTTTTTSSSVTTNKRLVIFAGPHKTSETSVEEFFYTFASSFDKQLVMTTTTTHLDKQLFEMDVSLLQALKGWSWPRVSPSYFDFVQETEVAEEQQGVTIPPSEIFDQVEPYQVYQFLVTNPNDSLLQRPLLYAIQHHYQSYMTSKGIIIGSVDFDRAGMSRYTQYNSVNAIKAVINDNAGTLVSTNDVTIILLYRTPRVQQWISISNSEKMVVKDGETDTSTWDSYTSFLCDSVYKADSWEFLDSAMNPFYLATKFREQEGWNIVLIDMAGVEKAQKNINHVIGCEVLQGECDSNGWLVNLKDNDMASSFQQDSTTHDTMNGKSFTDLSKQQQDDLEKLLRYRDCYYVPGLINYNNGFQILYKEDSIWDTTNGYCANAPTGVPQKLAQDPDFFYNAVQSQVQCNSSPVNIPNILLGKLDQASMNEVAAANVSDGNGIGIGRPQWYIPVFLFVFIGVGGLALFCINRSSKAQERRRQEQEREAQDGMCEIPLNTIN